MNDKVHTIRDQFPEKVNTIDILMEKDPEFLTMCEDYDVCLNALQYWLNSKEPEAKHRANEYRTLVRELREEIDQALIALEQRLGD